MVEWPHAPTHVFNFKGAYIVTAGTFQKGHFFKTHDDLNLLQRHLFELAEKYEWKLEAWALFSNHYHFIAQSSQNPENLRVFITHFHANTSRELNRSHKQSGRKVWYQYWDTQLTYQRSYYARLNYVMQNPVKHGLVDCAKNYPWSSLNWFLNNANKPYRDVIESFKTDEVQIKDDY